MAQFQNVMSGSNSDYHLAHFLIDIHTHMAADMLPVGSVAVFDSATTAMGTGLQALAAAEAVRAGKTLPEIMAKLERLRDGNRIYIAVPTLQHLRRSGRVSQAQALLAGILNIKVILTAADGLVVVREKARSWQNAIGRLERLVESAGSSEPLIVAVQHTDALAEAKALYNRLEGRIAITRGYISELSASLAVHGGPGMLGVAYCPTHLFES